MSTNFICYHRQSLTAQYIYSALKLGHIELTKIFIVYFWFSVSFNYSLLLQVVLS